MPAALTDTAKKQRWGEAHYKQAVVVLVVLLSLAVISALCLGRYRISIPEIFRVLTSKVFPIEKTWKAGVETVIFQVRIPRIIAGFLVGAGLSLSGASLQAMFRNPLVSSQILGVASGAGFGAAVAILLFESILITQLFSFAFGLLAVFLTWSMSRRRSSTPVILLVLSGIVVGSLFSSMTSMAKYLADPMNKMPAIVFWLLGSLNHVSVDELFVLAPVMIISGGILLAVRWKINVLTMGDESAKALGVNTEQLKRIVIICSTLLTASAVCMCGIIGWIGLVIPHIGRLITGPDNKRLMPVCVFAGGAFMVSVDTLARTVTSTEIPLGVLTAVIGAPIFATLLMKKETGW
jgi:iron complex transport system permease protein